MTYPKSDPRLDEIDQRILYALMQDARNTTAASIADLVNVSGATVRNRIQKLEEQDVIRGYPVQIDFERAGGKLTNLYRCNAPVPERGALAQRARSIPSVVNVRTLMTGRENLHVLAVADTTAELQRVSRALTQLDIEIEDEDLVEDEFFSPYAPFDPETGADANEPNDFISLTGEADILELTVHPDAVIAGQSIEAAVRNGVLDDDTLIIGIERDDKELTPHGDTSIEADDVVTILSRNATESDDLDVFRASDAERTRP